MKNFCQKDPKWANDRIGNTNLTIGKYGCFITSLGMITDKTPDLVNTLLRQNQCFDSWGRLYAACAAKALGLTYEKTYAKQTRTCIAETSDYARYGYFQHFFVWLGDGRIIDSLDGREKQNPYNNVSYRVFNQIQRG